MLASQECRHPMTAARAAAVGHGSSGFSVTAMAGHEPAHQQQPIEKRASRVANASRHSPASTSARTSMAGTGEATHGHKAAASEGRASGAVTGTVNGRLVADDEAVPAVTGHAASWEGKAAVKEVAASVHEVTGSNSPRVADWSIPAGSPPGDSAAGESPVASHTSFSASLGQPAVQNSQPASFSGGSVSFSGPDSQTTAAVEPMRFSFGRQAAASAGASGFGLGSVPGVQAGKAFSFGQHSAVEYILHQPVSSGQQTEAFGFGQQTPQGGTVQQGSQASSLGRENANQRFSIRQPQQAEADSSVEQQPGSSSQDAPTSGSFGGFGMQSSSERETAHNSSSNKPRNKGRKGRK